jgi:hypothetical protein
MKRQNLVWLDGWLQDACAVADPADGPRATALAATIVTDSPAQGGHHRVLLPGRLAIEAWAFLEAAGGQTVEVSVDGWLRSHGRDTVVVADRVAYHVGQSVRQAAGRRVVRLLAERQ